MQLICEEINAAIKWTKIYDFKFAHNAIFHRASAYLNLFVASTKVMFDMRIRKENPIR